MSKRIESYYTENNIPAILLKQKLDRFERHKDIAAEFEYWIEHKRYIEKGCIVEGYSAARLAELTQYLDGEGAFIMLIELREEPRKALKRISEGFKRK